MIVVNDALFEHHSRPAQNVSEAKELMLEDIEWFRFYCDQQASTAKNSKEAREWRKKSSEARNQFAIVHDTSEELIANSGMVCFVGEHVFQIRVSNSEF